MSAPELMTAADYGQMEAPQADHRITYGDDPSQFGDLFLPSSNTKAAGVVLLLHGGCWRAQYGLEPMGKMARALADHGVAVWSLEYRRVGNGGGWPNTYLDVARGADLLRELAPKYNLDVDNVVVSGHSAGGHLALWSAGRSSLPASSPIYTADPIKFKSVVAIAPVCDLERALAWDICSGATDVMGGGHPKEAWANYYQGSPSAMLPIGVRHITLNGALDHIVPLEYVTPFVETAEKLGDDASLIPIPDIGHFEIVMPDHPAGQLVIETILAELRA